MSERSSGKSEGRRESKLKNKREGSVKKRR